MTLPASKMVSEKADVRISLRQHVQSGGPGPGPKCIAIEHFVKVVESSMRPMNIPTIENLVKVRNGSTTSQDSGKEGLSKGVIEAAL